jgi:nucleoside-diphosphate-sugar epimerase
MMQNVIITGATSMIGSAIVTEALSRGLYVTAISRANSERTGLHDNLSGKKNIEIIECDIKNYSKLMFNRKYDAFFHLAWQSTDAASRDDVYTHIDNIKYTIDAVHAAHRAGCGVFVFAGSQAEYGRVSEKLSGDTVCNPESGYGIAKYSAGKMANLAASQLGMRFCHARILSTYGEGMDDKTLIIYLVKTLLAGERPVLTKCEQIWDYMYVKDTATAMLAIAESGIDGKIYPLGSGYTKTLREYVEIIRDNIDSSIEPGFGEKEYYPHQPMYLCADISSLTGDTGFIPSVSFENGIKQTIDWVKNNFKGVGSR